VHVGHWTQAAVVHGGRWKQAARGVAGQASVRLVLHLVLDAVMCYTLALCSRADNIHELCHKSRENSLTSVLLLTGRVFRRLCQSGHLSRELDHRL